MGAVDDIFDSAAGHLNAQHGRLVAGVVWMIANTSNWQGDGLWTPEAYARWRAGVGAATASKRHIEPVTTSHRAT